MIAETRDRRAALEDVADALCCQAVTRACRDAPVEVVTEYGRAVAAEHAALVIECLGLRARATGTGPQVLAVCDFSVFSGVPDAWGLGEEFAVTPLAGMDRAPLGRAQVCDVTCDPDGALPGEGLQMPHSFALLPGAAECGFARHRGEECAEEMEVGVVGGLVGVLGVGAYQRMLASSHNNVPMPDLVHVRLD